MAQRAHSYLRWVPGVRDARHNGSDFRAIPRPRIPLAPRDEAIFLLQLAAETEHALMVEYLYALYSLGGDAVWPAEHVEELTSWTTLIRGIALQEMGHLATVQNLLLSLGGPLHFAREQMPHRSPFYPFPFELTAVDRDSLAKFICAEMPPWHTLGPSTKRKLRPILRRAAAANGGRVVNRVGALYERLIEVFGRLNEAVDFDFSTSTLQATATEWTGAADQNNANALAADLLVCPIQWKDDALRSLHLIAIQGEGISSSSTPDSHFVKFLRIFDAYPETNSRYGAVGWIPQAEVPTHPHTSELGRYTRRYEAGRITARSSRRIAQLFDIRYRNLLTLFLVCFSLDRTTDAVQKRSVRRWIKGEMKGNIRLLALSLTMLPRKSPDEFIGGRLAMAGAPFRMPFDLSIPTTRRGRWRTLLDLIDVSTRMVDVILRDHALPTFVMTSLENLRTDDQARKQAIEGFLP